MVFVRLTKNPIVSERTKHIDVKYHFTRERVEMGDIEVVGISTKKMLADLMTKALPEETHLRLTSGVLGLQHASGGV